MPKQSEARKFYDIGKKIDQLCVVTHCFQSNSVNVFKVEISFKKQIKKISTGFVFMLPEM